MNPSQQRRHFGPRLRSRSFFWGKSLIRRPQLSEMRAVGVGAKDADKGTAGMAGTLGERFWAWLHETFPERQIYIRSDGRVQFFTFGPTLQATLASLTLIFLGWVAFATVNVIFKDRIIAAKDHRYQQMHLYLYKQHQLLFLYLKKLRRRQAFYVPPLCLKKFSYRPIMK